MNVFRHLRMIGLGILRELVSLSERFSASP
jgi:hypothetical protein